MIVAIRITTILKILVIKLYGFVEVIAEETCKTLDMRLGEVDLQTIRPILEKEGLV
ncbi:hypothetical protein [Clostridium tagluense]|uniref:Uncharacterized protein n=1 Tax=Clostridium tagluense TaxID=360422 RepID=A0A401UHM6_9CLOT|nr:hypothetical protein [Clostridium tagluense]GCD09006.1 hypothetical protein Ctaglu_06290 [Clostridium tagluense]